MSTVQILPEATAPTPTRTGDGPAIPPRMRARPYTFAALTRQAGRRATWARVEREAVLSPVAMTATVVGALTIALAVGGWVVTW